MAKTDSNQLPIGIPLSLLRDFFRWISRPRWRQGPSLGIAISPIRFLEAAQALHQKRAIRERSATAGKKNLHILY